MLNAIAIGALWGAVMGRYLILSPEAFKWLGLLIISSTALAVFCFGKSSASKNMRSVWIFPTFAALSALWSALHNPWPVAVFDRDLRVLWAIGCAESDHEILIHDDLRVYSARGSALEGDLVRLVSQDIRSRFFLVETTGYKGDLDGFCQIFAQIRAKNYESLNKFPVDIKHWLSGFALGKSSDVDKGLIRSFRDVGLLHVLVLSGGHLSVVAGLFLFCLRVPFLLLYLLRRLNVKTWIYIWNGTAFISVVLLFAYCAVVGFAQSVQRAFLNFVVCHVVSMLGLAQDTKTKIKLTFCLQAIVFPVNLLSMSLLLSWSGSLVLHAFHESTFLKSKAQAFLHVAKIQLFFLASTLIFFGEAGVLTPVANLLALPVFGILLPIDLAGLIFKVTWLNDFLVPLNRAAVQGVRLLSYYQSDLPVSHVRIPSFLTIESPEGRLMVVILMTVMFLLSGLRQQDLSLRSPRRH